MDGQWKGNPPTLLSRLATGENQWLLPSLKFGLGYARNQRLHPILVKFPVTGTAHENTSESLFSFIAAIGYKEHMLQRQHCSVFPSLGPDP